MLTPTQIDARKGKLTASRIAVLMNGNLEGIMRLYQEMRGEIPEVDMSDVWPVRLGQATEALNLEWYERKNNTKLSGQGVVIQSSILAFAACTLDGWDERLKCPVECKHTGGREPVEVVIDRYQPQMQWQMMVTEASQCAISIILGANPPIIEFIERNDDYIDEMIQRGVQFMECVEKGTPPVALPAVPPPADAKLIYDMATSNQWASEADEWLDTREAASRNDDAAKILKSLVPADAKKCFGHGVQITRDRAGRLSLREHKP
jgi:predicted phage-related endonuclease